ncbi:hypothetical protein Lal_00033891 [Lupinus albus]|nr:hypothetical protein Lal_00033891 [Lupinus albus]
MEIEHLVHTHRNDQPTAPKDNPSIDPPEPQPSSFHVKSSLSSIMPTNQLVMDELVSLQGFITTRMKVFGSESTSPG